MPMTILSARQWSATRSPWGALVFWLWLGSFVFGLAANDGFHAATCPEQVLFKWAARAGHNAVSVQHDMSHSDAADVDCAACALAGVALWLMAVGVPLVVQLRFAPLEKRLIHAKPTFSPALSIARAPPARS